MKGTVEDVRHLFPLGYDLIKLTITGGNATTTETKARIC
jgi:hypothetical protein